MSRQLFFSELMASASVEGDRGDVRINTGMLVLAREAKGYTQKELASLLSFTQSRLSKIESAELLPTERDILKIGNALDQDRDFFVLDAAAMPASVSFYRKAQTLPLKMLRRCNAEMNVRRVQLARRLNGRTLCSRTLPSITPDADRGAKGVAGALRKQWGVQHGPLWHLVKFVEDAGCVILDFSFPSSKLDGISIRCPENLPMVFLNKDLPKSRRRLSLAHELGHLIMHSNPHERVEDEAWEFAEELLMPSVEAAEQLESLDLDKLGQLKTKWGISLQALLQRAKKLGRISESSYRSLWVQIAKCGFRVNEPFEDLIPDERPTDIEQRLRDANIN